MALDRGEKREVAKIAKEYAGGGGGLSNVVDDTSPQLGGTLDMNGQSINAGGTAISPTELGYLDNVTSNIQTQLNSKGTGSGDMLAANNLSDVANAASARTNLGVDAAGTDNSTDVTLAGTGTYISISGQVITVDDITESDISDLGTYQVQLAEGAFADGDKTKLDTIETSADVTDETNVVSSLSGATLTDAGTPASSDKVLIQDTSDSNNLKYAAFSEFGGAGGGGDAVSVSITQTTHGLAVGDVVRSSGTDGQYTKAQADSEANAEVVGIVTVVDDVNNFTMVTSGLVDVAAAVPNETAGTVLYLDPDTAGALTATEPTNPNEVTKPVAIVTTANSEMQLVQFRGMVIDGTESTVFPYSFGAVDSRTLATATQSQTTNYDTESFDANNNFNDTTGEYECPVDGIYQFNAIVRGIDIATDRRVLIWLDKNDVEQAASGTSSGAATHDIGATISITLSCSAGDLIHVEAYHDHGSDRTIQTYFSGYLLQPIYVSPTLADTSWQTPTLENSWVDYGGSYATAQYRKDSDGFVHIKGLVKNGSTASADIFSLPSGYRPAEHLIFTGYGSGGIIRIDVDTDGDVWCAAGGSTSYSSLDGITFYADGS